MTTILSVVVLVAATCVGWRCGNPYGTPFLGGPPREGAVERVYTEVATGCLARTDGTLTGTPPTYLGGSVPALVGRSVDVEVCRGTIRLLPLGDTRWLQLPVHGALP